MLYFYVNLGWRHQYCRRARSWNIEGITFYFIDNEYYFGRAYIYGLGGDEGERFAFFCRAVLEALPKLDFIPDVLHCHDWQTGMIPGAAQERSITQLEFYRDIKTVYTIHNLQYQGVFPIGRLRICSRLGDWACHLATTSSSTACARFMKGGLVFADEITTVSPTYAHEIQTAYLRRAAGRPAARAQVDQLSGILNGIDVNEYDPATDPQIDANYDRATPSSGKDDRQARRFRRSSGLKVDPNPCR